MCAICVVCVTVMTQHVSMYQGSLISTVLRLLKKTLQSCIRCSAPFCLAWGDAGVMLGSCWGHRVLLYHVTVNAGVRAIVLDVDTAQQRLSLGLKASYFDGAGDAEEAVDGKAEVQLHVLTCCLGIIFDSHCT